MITKFSPHIPTVLQKIVQDKQAWVTQQKAAFPLSEFEKNIEKSDRTFYGALGAGTHQRPAYILECKKASPSKGLIRADFHVADIADVYKHYAAVISVLTDEKYFQGRFDYVRQVRERVSQPVLCKDFIIDDYQIYLARYHQADAVLLMLSVLDDDRYRRLAALAHSLNMGVLTEAATESEVARAVALGAKVIGINNRNLHDLSVDPDRTLQLGKGVPADRILISESGIGSHRQVQRLKTVAHGFLIGSRLMGSSDLNAAVRSVIFGENKVCGLTRPQDVQAAYDNGALYGGLIFAEASPRRLSLPQAQALITAAPLRFVGVFQNQSIEMIENIAKQLNLYAVQLHGSETPEFITALRTALPDTCQIWKAISVDIQTQSAVKFSPVLHVDRYVIDSQNGNRQGGTGDTFDWSLIPPELKERALLAGGIHPDNVCEALKQNCLGLDINSGVESGKGIKDPQKLNNIFQNIIEF